MQKNKIEFLLDTDVIYEHLVSGSSSVLVELLQIGLGFTTVLNAAEIMRKCKSEEDEYSAKSVLSALKVLGIHSRYSLSVNKISQEIKSLRDLLFMVTAEVNKIDIVTLNPKRYLSDRVKILTPSDLIMSQTDNIN